MEKINSIDFKIFSAEYKTSATNSKQFLNLAPEIAFVGRSNVGKSSLINILTNKKKLAKTSSTPGLTKMVNYFFINNEFFFVDLPGYGFSKTGKQHKKLWSTLIDEYLQNSPYLKLVLFLIDIRHKPTELDIQMHKYLFYNQIPYKIIATKIDKIAKSKINAYLIELANNLNVGKDNIIPYSALNKFGKNKILEIIYNFK